MMIEAKSNLSMEYPSISDLDAFWHPTFEDGSVGMIANGIQQHYDNNSVIGYTENWRKLPNQLLLALEGQDGNEVFDNGWLEEPMDLDIFEQSIASGLDESFSYSSSPIFSNPTTPIHTSSPEGIFMAQIDVQPIKYDVPVISIPDENEELIVTLESLLSQIEPVDISGGIKLGELGQEIDPTAFLDSLIQGDVEEGVILDEIADLALPTEKSESFIYLTSVPSVGSNSSFESESQSSETDQHRRISRIASVTKPSTRGRKAKIRPEDRRDRKKEQNKTAATRYREKKKLELEILLEEEAQLEKRNGQLRRKHDSLAQEVRLMRKLMRDFFSNRPGKKS
jgi:hypothetical protein